MSEKIGTREYLKSIVKDPLVASVTPTSKFGVNCLLKNLDFSKDMLVVEYGPGGGVITKSLLSRLTPNSKLIAIENNEIFYKALKHNLKDSRLILFLDSAENIQSILSNLYKEGQIASEYADVIISGIPFSMFPNEMKDKILEDTRNSLIPEGRFLVYQFLVSLTVGKTDIKLKLRQYFDMKRSHIVLRNVPPLRVFETVKMKSIDLKRKQIDISSFIDTQNNVKIVANDS